MLKEEMRILGSLTMEAAQQTSVSAGGALAVDRERFSDFITERILAHPLIEVVHQRVDHLPEGTGIVASGPLTEEHLAQDIAQLCGESYLSFFDAAAPIVTFESLDKDKVFFAARYGRGEDDYINCPMDKEQYEAFYEQLVQAESVQLHSFEREQMKVYEGCMPVEVMAKRGADTLRYGPLKPVGLTDPHRTPPVGGGAAAQRKPSGQPVQSGGLSDQLKIPRAKAGLFDDPGLEQAEFVRYGVMHRNTFLDSPRLLESDLSLKNVPKSTLPVRLPAWRAMSNRQPPVFWQGTIWRAGCGESSRYSFRWTVCWAHWSIISATRRSAIFSRWAPIWASCHRGRRGSRIKPNAMS